MLKAIIFDFDGIIAHTEPIHLEAFQKTLGGFEIDLSTEEYYKKYIAFDDKTLFKEILKDKAIEPDKYPMDELMIIKAAHYDALILDNMELLPGSKEFIALAADDYPIAIGSGAFRHEILQILEHAGIERYFTVIVSADDVERSKPAPDVFLEVLSRLNSAYPDSEIHARNCLVIEDSKGGIEAALAAGMKCLAITNSYPEEELVRAHMVKKSLKGLSLKELQGLF